MSFLPNNPAEGAAYLTLALAAILALLCVGGIAICLWNIGIMLTKLVVLTTLGGTVGDSLFLAFVYAAFSAFIASFTALGTWVSWEATKGLWRSTTNGA